MPEQKRPLKYVLLGTPVAVILGISFFPLPIWAQQALVLFALVWFNLSLLLDLH